MVLVKLGSFCLAASVFLSQVYPMKVCSSLHIWAACGKNVEHSTGGFWLQDGQPVPLLKYHAKRGFAGYSASVVKKLHKARLCKSVCQFIWLLWLGHEQFFQDQTAVVFISALTM